MNGLVRQLRPAGGGLLTVLLCGLLAALLAALALARPWVLPIDVGPAPDTLYLDNFLTYEYSDYYAVDFRWSRPEAALQFAGAGQPVRLGLRIHSNSASTVIDLDDGSGPVAVPLRQGWQQLHLLPRAHAWSGDVAVAISAPEQRSAADSRKRGIVLDQMELHGAGSAPPGQVVLLGGSVVLLAGLALWLSRRWWLALLVGLAAAGGVAGLLLAQGGAWRLLLTSYSRRLLLVLLLVLLLALATEKLLGWLARRGLMTGGVWARRGVAVAVALAFLLRFGAMAYPYNFISDIRYNLSRAATVRDGDLGKLFFPNTGLTPVQWEVDITIPRSPFYYIVTAPFTYFAEPVPALAMMAFSSAVDALAVLLVALLAVQLGGGGRAALCGALLAGTLPLGLLVAMSWGIFPTLLAQSLALAAAVGWLWLRPHLARRGAQFALAGLLLLAYIAYPTGFMFLGMTWLLLVGLLLVRRDPAALPTLGAGLLANAGALLLFYGWHMPELLRRTLPTLLDSAVAGSLSGSAVSLERVVNLTWKPLVGQFGPLVYALALAGGALLLLGRWPERTRYAGLLLLAWCGSYLPFALADAYILTLLIKHIVFLLPALAVLAGLLLARLTQRRGGWLVVGAVLALVLWQGVLLELDKIIHAYAHLKHM